MIHYAANVHEAVRMAEGMKTNREFDWFRGQIGNWPLMSSFLRLASKERQACLDQIGRFEQWVKSTRGLEVIAASTDMTIAVAQHYGLATNFIDFTTEPSIAGFFASHGSAVAGQTSCILCLRAAAREKFWTSVPQLIRLTVPNLWRLEAQRGVFLYCPMANFEKVYDLDRIVFPYTGPVSEPPEEAVYPSRKSPLETLLDQYFLNERLIQGNRNLEGLFSTVQRSSQPVNYDPELLPNGPPPVHPSWHRDRLAAWLQLPVEPLPRVTGEKETVSRASQRLRDGLRRLPYTDRQVADGMACCAALAAEWVKAKRAGPVEWDQICPLVIADAMEVELGADDGSYARAYVSAKSLAAAVRADILEYVSPRYRTQLQGNATGLLQAVWSPERLFDYDKLAELMATQMAPTQVWLRPGLTVFYSAARLCSLRLA